MCWRMGPRVDKAKWILVGSVNEILRIIDNKLGVFLFSTDLAVEFKECVSYSLFEKLNEIIFDWYISMEEFDSNTCLNTEKVWKNIELL